jgi:carbonic anhydrase
MNAPPRLGRPFVSRRELIRGVVVAAGGFMALQVTPARAAPAAGARNPDDVLRALLQGNRRFSRGQPAAPRRRPEDFAALAEGQRPVAVVVGCSDSRVPPEIVFDQGVGDLFVVRVAGNVVSGAGLVVKGSIEYGVAELGTPLVVVLGHSGCGAVKAAIAHIEAHDALPGAIGALVDAIRPVVASVAGKPGNLLENAIRANVETGVLRLKGLEPIVAPAVKQGAVKVVGAVYDLRSGGVTLVA